MGNRPCRSLKIQALFLGLKGVRKTSLLYHLKHGEIVQTIPTIGYNVVSVDIDGIEVTLWEVNSRSKVRILWYHYFEGSHGFVFVIDSADKESLDEAMDLLYHVIRHERTQDSVFMVVANKQDQEGAMSAQQVEDYLLERNAFYRGSTCLVVACNALDMKQVSQIFTFFAHLMYLNHASKLKRGLITLKEQSKMQEQSKVSAFKSLLQDPVGYLKSFF